MSGKRKSKRRGQRRPGGVGVTVERAKTLLAEGEDLPAIVSRAAKIGHVNFQIARDGIWRYCAQRTDRQAAEALAERTPYRWQEDMLVTDTVEGTVAVAHLTQFPQLVLAREVRDALAGRVRVTPGKLREARKTALTG